MNKVLKLFGVGLILFSISCSHCEPIVKHVPIYQSPVNTCIAPGVAPICGPNPELDDFANFEILQDCLAEHQAYNRKAKNYIDCLQKFFK